MNPTQNHDDKFVVDGNGMKVIKPLKMTKKEQEAFVKAMNAALNGIN